MSNTKWLFKYYILFSYILCSSCSDAQNKNMYNNLSNEIKEINKDYIKTRNFFKTVNIEHFPSALDSSYLTFTESLSPDLGEISLYLINRLNKNINTNDYLKRAISVYNPNDTCLLVVNRFATKDNFYKIKISEEEKKIIDLSCYNDLLPIPNFWNCNYFSDKNCCNLSSDFNIIVLEAKQGKFLDKEYLTDGYFMPKKWKNGFSRGVAISEERQAIIYWVVVW